MASAAGAYARVQHICVWNDWLSLCSDTQWLFGARRGAAICSILTPPSLCCVGRRKLMTRWISAHVEFQAFDSQGKWIYFRVALDASGAEIASTSQLLVIDLRLISMRFRISLAPRCTLSRVVCSLRGHARMYGGGFARVVDHVADRSVIAEGNGDHVMEPPARSWAFRLPESAQHPDR